MVPNLEWLYENCSHSTHLTSNKKKRENIVESRMDSCGWTRMGNEEREEMAGADAAASWQQCYTWCTPYSHPHPHPHHHHTLHPRQYQGSQYQQLPGSASAAANASTTHYPSSQQHHLQLQTAQPPPLDQQQHLHSIRGQTGLKRALSYDGPGIQITPKYLDVGDIDQLCKWKLGETQFLILWLRYIRPL